ncbi:MAG TPA: TPM domain-containing protein [Tepidisphaeraceae bacterium]|jgi:uncharacterized membrane protein YgcG|nr:TPM domain-containing protein [Tepidisphaeraceae bacterium]
MNTDKTPNEMMQRHICPLLGSILIAILALIGPAATTTSAAATPTVRDEAHLFDDATLSQVTAAVREIRQKFDKDLTIETFATIPDILQPRFAAEDKNTFYEHWLRDEARAAKTDGIFVLIVKNPGRLQIGVGDKTKAKAFTYADRDEMRDLMLKDFRKAKFNDGMIAGAKFALERLEKNGAEPKKAAPGAPADPSPPPAKIQSAPAAPPASEPAPAEHATTRPAAAAPTTKSSTDVEPAKSIESNK